MATQIKTEKYDVWAFRVAYVRHCKAVYEQMKVVAY